MSQISTHTQLQQPAPYADEKNRQYEYGRAISNHQYIGIIDTDLNSPYLGKIEPTKPKDSTAPQPASTLATNISPASKQARAVRNANKTSRDKESTDEGSSDEELKNIKRKKLAYEPGSTLKNSPNFEKPNSPTEQTKKTPSHPPLNSGANFTHYPMHKVLKN